MRDDQDSRPTIYVLAGTNGAGKSSVGGATFKEEGAEYFNPDEVARRVLADNPDLTVEQANSIAWHEGKRLLECAIDKKLNWVFETTLGGNTIPALLHRAAETGLDVQVLYVGLASPELHIARVQARVARGGHDIPESKIRERYDQSRVNLIHLLPWLTSLRLYDNSDEGDPATVGPQPKLILHLEEGRIREVLPMSQVPQWARPIVLAALRT
ncbi:MAG TPA: zeta toxin family protein [Longimicrobium sp.]